MSSATKAAGAQAAAPSSGKRDFDVSRLHWSSEGAKQAQFQSHPVFEADDIGEVYIEHKAPRDMTERIALAAVTTARGGFDLVTAYGRNMTEDKWLTRFIFLETVAGVPGMVGAMTRHLHSLRRMDRDRGWISLLLGEAENERMHLMTFVEERRSTGLLFRAGVLFTQGIAWNLYFLAYLLSPRGCHAFVGYLEEEAVTTYTKAIAAIDAGELPRWTDHPACPVAKKYWGLPDDATFRDVLLQVRADEAVHCKVNHVLSEAPQHGPSPFGH